MATVRNRKLVCKFKLETLKLEEAELSLVAPPEGAMIKALYSGICHSDIHIRKGNVGPDTMWPRVLAGTACVSVCKGHEIAGEVVSIGAAKIDSGDDVRVGDRVLVYPWGGCRKCATCQTGPQHCPTRALPGSQLYGLSQDGGFQEYVTLYDRRLLFKIPESLPSDVASIVPCSGITAYNGISCLRESVVNGVKTHGDGVVLIVGAGGLGLWATSITKAMFPSNIKICVVDINKDKLDAAESAGADIGVLIDPSVEPAESAEKIKAAAGTLIYGAADYVGLPSTIETAFRSLLHTGTLSVVGLHGRETPSVSLRLLVARAIRIQGAYVGSIEQTKELIKLVTDGKVNPPKLTHVSLPEVEDTLKKLEDGRIVGRAVIRF